MKKEWILQTKETRRNFSKATWIDTDQDGSGILSMMYKLNGEMVDRLLSNTSEVGRIALNSNDAQDYNITVTANSITISKGQSYGAGVAASLITILWTVE